MSLAAYQLSVPVNASKAQLVAVTAAGTVKETVSCPTDIDGVAAAMVVKNPAEDPKGVTAEAAAATTY